MLQPITPANAWFEQDAFWHDFEDAMFSAERWTSAVHEAELIAAMLGLQPGGSILDLACGPGRHSLEFARRGFHVTGVDRTERYLDRARAAAAAERLDVTWVQSDMRAFRREAAFDAATCLFTSFGYFDEADDDRRVAENLCASLRPGGRAVFEMMGREPLVRKFQPTSWSRLADGRLWLEERVIVDSWSRIDTRWILIDGSQRVEHCFSLRLYSASELRTLLRGAGFESVTCFGGLDRSPYDHNAARLVAIAQRDA